MDFWYSMLVSLNVVMRHFEQISPNKVLNSEKFSVISYFKGLNSDSKQMRWAPTCNNREASGMAYGEYEDDF